VDQSLAATGIPGAAVAVVQDGQVVHLAGYGVADENTGVPVDANTRFRTASVGKSMTTAFIATQVDRGRMSWDQPMTDFLPSFALADPADTARMTVERSVCHCSSVQRTDDVLAFEGGEDTPGDVIARLANVSPSTPFGQVFGYSNQLVATGGWAATIAAGGSPFRLQSGYRREIEQYVFDPAGMEATTLSPSRVAIEGNVASSHAIDLEAPGFKALDPSSERLLSAIGPAGDHWSTAPDLARYLQMQLDDGRAADGTQVVSTENLYRTWTPQIPVDGDTAYALGWFVDDYYGEPLVHHGGNAAGFTTEVAFMPDHDLGIVVLTNGQGANDLTVGIRDFVIEGLFDLPAVSQDSVARYTTTLAEVRPQFEPVVDPSVVAPFLRTFTSPELGDVTISVNDEGAVFADTGTAVSELKQPVGAEPNALVGSGFTLTTDDAGTPTLTIDGAVFMGPDATPSPMTPAPAPAVLDPKV
jgi:CubicO group peptidase (beta-lactamase class C family)